MWKWISITAKTLAVFILAFCFFSAAPGFSGVYRYVDENGVVHYTNEPIRSPEGAAGDLAVPDRRSRPPEQDPSTQEAEPSVPIWYDAGSGPEKGAAAEGDAGALSSERVDDGDGQGSFEDEEDLIEALRALNRRQAALHEELAALLKEKKDIEHSRQFVNTPEEMAAYNERIFQFNERVQEFNARREAYDAAVGEFNAKHGRGDSPTAKETVSPEPLPEEVPPNQAGNN